MSATRTIELSRGYTTTVDAEDYDYLSQFNWHAVIAKGTPYAIRKVTINGKRVVVRLHRVVVNAPDDLSVDHINRNTLDNRKSNLRICTQQENMRNAGMQSRNTSGYRGVSAFKNKWRAVIYVMKKQTCLGYFDTPEDAARAYDRAALELFGEFASPNF